MHIPTHKGRLESLSAEHVQELFELVHASRGHLHKWLPWLKHIHTPQDMHAFVNRLVADRGPQFVIKVEGRICGGVGFYVLNKSEKLCSLGYWLGNEFTGQGIMQDAALHLCHYGFKNLALEKAEIRCAEQNLQSRKLPERLGFYLEGVQSKAEWLTDRYVDHAIYSILKAEFDVLYPEGFFKHR